MIMTIFKHLWIIVILLFDLYWLIKLIKFKYDTNYYDDMTWKDLLKEDATKGFIIYNIIFVIFLPSFIYFINN